MLIKGIDPGATGAVASYFRGAWWVDDAPVIEAKRKRKVMNPQLCRELLGTEPAHVFIERQQSMPGQGVSSTFQIGRNFGLWEGVAAGLGFQITIVGPRAWKKEMLPGIPKENQKEAARLRALQLFPGLAAQLARKKDHGRAEALLITEYGRRLLGV